MNIMYAQRNPARQGTVTASSDSSTTAKSASTTSGSAAGGSTVTGSTATSSTSTAATQGSSGDAATDFRALFSGKPAPPDPTPAKPATPTAQSVFGDNPWITNPGGVAPNGVTYGYNPYYFATPSTASKVAQMIGGTVVQTNAITPYGPFQQNQPNQMVQLPNGKQLNAGIIASFYDHGYSQQYINMLISNEVNDTTT